MTALLETHELCKSFGALRAAHDIDFRLEAGARHALIGPNGAGKTTFINLLTGVLPPSAGKVLLNGEDITRCQAERVKLGIARTFQINRLFRGLSVLDNVALAVAERAARRRAMLRPPAAPGRDRRGDASARQRSGSPNIAGTTRFRNCPMAASAWSRSPSRSGLKPKVLLLDEPAAGVPSAETHIILDAIDALPKSIGVLIIEHDMDLVFRFAQRITVLVRGAVFAEGTPKEIGADPRRARRLSRAGHHG